jgi:hypothetical protein
MASACPNRGILKPLGWTGRIAGLWRTLRGAVWRFEARTSCTRALTKAGQILSMLDAGSQDFALFPRVQLSLTQVGAGLRATMPARAIVDDVDEPITELGKLHHAWVRERGLPSALEHHDHP